MQRLIFFGIELLLHCTKIHGLGHKLQIVHNLRHINRLVEKAILVLAGKEISGELMISTSLKYKRHHHLQDPLHCVLKLHHSFGL